MAERIVDHTLRQVKHRLNRSVTLSRLLASFASDCGWITANSTEIRTRKRDLAKMWIRSVPRNDTVVVTVSDLALMVLNPMLGSLAHAGINPQRSKDNWRIGFSGLWRTTGTGCVGAML